MKAVFIKLNNPEEVKMIEKVRKVTAKNYSDLSKTTKMLWSNYLKEVK